MAFHHNGQDKLAIVDEMATEAHPPRPYTKANTDPGSAGALDDAGSFGVNLCMVFKVCPSQIRIVSRSGGSWAWRATERGIESNEHSTP